MARTYLEFQNEAMSRNWTFQNRGIFDPSILGFLEFELCQMTFGGFLD
jgi:hypothetical protein